MGKTFPKKDPLIEPTTTSNRSTSRRKQMTTSTEIKGIMLADVCKGIMLADVCGRGVVLGDYCGRGVVLGD
jgi:hypothetical protein